MAQTEIAEVRKRGRAELIATLADARSGISADASEIVDRINVPRRIRRSLSDAPVKRAATALLAGLASSRLLSKRRPRSKHARQTWFGRLFPDFDMKKLVRLLLTSYLEPEKVDLRAIIRERLREYLK